MVSAFRIATIVLLLGLPGLTACSYGHRGADPKSVRLNARPQEIVEVSGTVAPPLRAEKLRAVYLTHSSLPFCNGLNFPDGGPFPRRLYLDVPTIEAGGRLTAKIAVDRYAGLCGWRLSDINAVVRDGDRDRAEDLISQAWADLRTFERESLPRRDLTTSSCGYDFTDFSCGGVAAGDDSYIPVLTDREHLQVRFAIRLGRYPAPSGYRAPCRNADDGTPYSPCRPSRR
jgi:hypothetical protein